MTHPNPWAGAEPAAPGGVEDVLVIGGGPAGLAAARAISRTGASVRILEAGEHVGARWANHYDSLRLNSGRIISSLPGQRIDRRFGRWVARADFLDYLERYAAGSAVPIEFGARVERLEWTDGRWLVHTPDRILAAAAVVVATGTNGAPRVPDWAADQSFPGGLIHSDDYRNSTAYRGRDVLVVGMGSSAHDIALDLLKGGAARVRLSMRTPPLLVPKQILGLSSAILSLLVKYGPPLGDRLLDAVSFWIHRGFFPDANRLLGAPPAGLATALRERGHGATLEVGLLEAVRRGAVEIVAAVRGIEAGEVVLADEQRVRPDAVILATGYRCALEPLVGHLGVLDENGRPRAHGAQSLPDAPNLYFLGFRLPAGQLPDLSIDARRLARRLRRDAIGSGRQSVVEMDHAVAEPADVH